MAYLLGIDGGGTRTTAVLGDEQRVLAEAQGAASNITRVGEDRARDALRQCISEVCAKAGVDPSRIARIVAGVAGASRPQVSGALRRILQEITGGEIEITGDMNIAHQAALNGDPGLIVLSGTGSIAYGRNANGETARAGGWGFAISDEGSGHWIGRSAVAAALVSHDRGEDPPLLRAVLRRWELRSLDELVRMANATPPPDFSLLFPEVLNLANAGDVLARSLLIRAGEELAKLGMLVLGRLFVSKSAVRVAVAGGVFRNSRLVEDVFSSELSSDWPGVRVEQSTASPALGALYMARRQSVLT